MARSALAGMATAIDSSALLVYRAAWSKDQGSSITREAAMAKMTATEDWLANFGSADIPASPVHTLDDMRSDRHLEETDFFKIFASSSDGELVMPDISTKFSASPGSIRTAPPLLGEHTRQILAQLGYTDADIK